MSATATELQLGSYLEAFSAFEKTAPGHDLPWLQNLRREGFAQFCKVGFPTPRVEDWRFTNVAAIAQTPFRLAQGAGPKLPKDAMDGLRFPEAACQLVFLDGKFAPELSSFSQLPSGVRVTGLAKQIAEAPAEIEHRLGKYLNIQRDPFAALNSAFIADGGYVHIRRETVVEAPIYFVFVTTDQPSPVMTHPRNLVVAEEGAQATVVEDYVSLDGGVAFSNTVTELIAGENAVISHYMIERENRKSFNVSTLRIQQGRSANIASHSLLLGGALVRNNVHPVLAGEGGECLINGLFIGTGQQHLDNYMLVEHASPHCGSRQFYNGILDGHAHGVFHGRIVVHKDAQKTDAKQTNRNLLLSDQAQIDTKPQLEIFADDVKCTHGATIGQIEENALFYLRTRGIDEVSARRLLLLAFASECLDRMKEGSTRAHVDGLIRKHLLQMAESSSIPAQAGTGPRERNWEEVG